MTNRKGSFENPWTTYDVEPTKVLIPGDWYTNSVIPGTTNTKPEDWTKSKTHDISRYK